MVKLGNFLLRSTACFVAFEQDLTDDFSKLPFSVVHSEDDLDEMLTFFNALLSECLERHAPLRRVRVTSPPAPWINYEEIDILQHQPEIL